jgi:hypothetical protein
MGTVLSVSAKPCFVLLRPHGIAALFVMKRLGIGVFWGTCQGATVHNFDVLRNFILSQHLRRHVPDGCQRA